MQSHFPRQDTEASRSASRSLGPRWEGIALGAILLLALVVRVVFVLQMRASPYFDHPALDQGFYVEAGRAVAKGIEIRPGPIVRPPLYGWWLGLVFKLFGDSLLLPRLLQSLIGTATVALVYRLGKVALGGWTGLVAAFLAAVYWVLVYYDDELLREPLLNPLDLCAALWTLEFSRKPSMSKGLAAGIALGLAALLRPQALVVLPLFVVCLGFHSRVGWTRILGFVAAVALPILPITAYNWIVGHDFLLISAEGGQALWIGNNPTADGVGQVAPGTRGDFWGGYDDTRRLAEKEEGRELRPSEVSRHFVAKTWNWVSQNPWAETRLILRKLGLLGSDWEFGSPEEPRFFASRFAPITQWLPIGFGIVAALASVGILTTLKRGFLSQFPIWGFIACYGISVVAFIVGSRYRLPVVPFLVIFAGQGAVWMARAVSARRFVPVLAGTGLMSLVLAGSKLCPAPKEESTAHGFAWLAIAENREGNREAAVALFRQALSLSPNYCDARAYLGITLVALERREEAVRELQTAVRLCPDNVVALDSLSDLLLKLGRVDEAKATALRSIGVAPYLPRSRYNLGRACVAAGRAEEAQAAFQAAVSIDPSYFNAAYALGMIDLDLGRNEDAIRALAQAVANRRDSVGPEFLLSAYGALVDGLARMGRREEALAYAKELVGRLPGNAQALQMLRRFQSTGDR